MGGGPTGGPVTFWSALDATDREALLGLGTRVELAADTQLFAQGDASDYVVVVLGGWIKVVSYSSAGYRALLALRGPGDLLGEQAVLEGRPRSASLLAATGVEVLQLTAARFRAFAQSRQGTAAALEQTLSRRLREADEHRTNVTEPVAVRLAALLLDLGERCGEPVPHTGGIRIGLNLSQDDLAGLVLSSRRTVSRVLEQWRGQGLIATGRQSLRITSVDGLKLAAFGG
ncbi:Crp/Fnr family transcriptional regulator [Kitasatospora sp. NPDC048239]|uniref:Crp/Fnr family transcriptional regulator n=1 Tax=Kitasatospora sp. NPDC048239 TaxID=3364046 RepID=UPI0037226FC5